MPNVLTRREHAGAAPSTTLSAPIASSADTTFTIASGTSWPTGSTAPFIVTIDRGQPTEERILCSSRTGTTVTVAASGRGYDGTTAQAHASTATAEHTTAGVELDELNLHGVSTSGVHGVAGPVASTSDVQTFTNKTIDSASNTLTGIVLKSLVTTKGDVIGATAASTPARVAVGTDGQFLQADAASTPGVKWAQGPTLKSQTFTAGGTFTVPTGVTVVDVTAVGGGGGGVAGNGGTGGGGGGGGQVVRKVVSGLTPGGTVTVTIGGGGAAASAGSSTTFGASVTALGGAGGSGITQGNSAGAGTGGSWPGCGGVGGSLANGSDGQPGVNGYGGGGAGGGGNGGAHPGGSASTDGSGGGAGGAGVSSGTGVAGTAGTVNTGGGGGGGGGGTIGNGAGGAGGSGVVIVEWAA